MTENTSSIKATSLIATPSSPRYNSQSSSKYNHIRPNSEIFGQKVAVSPETEYLEKWVEDLAQYERTLEEMAKASLDLSFKEELGAVENWFFALSEAEKTAALYSLLHQSTNVQIRFFITVLQKMAKDPLRDILSSAHNRASLPTFNDYPLPNRKTNIDRHSMPLGKGNLPRPTSVSLDPSYTSNGSRLSLKSQSYNHEDSLGFSWKQSPGLANKGNSHLLPSLDLKNSNWNTWDLNNRMGNHGERSLSATNIKDTNWGKLGKSRNTNNLTLKVDNVEVHLDSPHWPSSSGAALNRPKSAKSPAFPPGLLGTASPTIWAATPLESLHPPLSSQRTTASPSGEDLKEPKPLDPVDFDVLENIPAWMRSLRLHKYTSIFEKFRWQEIILLDDKQLTELGVAALGARRKFLKIFEHVKNEADLKGISTVLPKN